MKGQIVEIDENSGFCFGVVNAINKAEHQLGSSETLYCLGDIVHNTAEVERLRRSGLISITHDDLEKLKDVKVLLRAHGEPPSTYNLAKANNIDVIDATCPVVLQLQRRIKMAYDAAKVEAQKSGKQSEMPLILIYGKPGHAEVNGLVGQTEGNAVVIQHISELDRLDLDRDILLYSQTTKSISGFGEMVEAIKARKGAGDFKYFDTICRQVANRMDKMKEFAASHDVIVFVSGNKSSNGKVLYSECKNVNPRTYLISSPSELNPDWTRDAKSVGVCGATSTPHWLMSEVADAIRSIS